MSKKVCKSWTESSSELVEISHVWTIKNFSLRNEKIMLSSIFSSPHDLNKRKWRMALNPYGESEEYKGHLSLFLCLTNPTEEEIEVSRLFSMHDDKGNCLGQTQRINKTYSKTSDSWGFPRLRKRDDILKELLPNDILKITCELSYVNVVKTFSGTEEESSLQADEQQASCNLVENLGAMLTNNDFSDVNLIILGKGEEERTEFKAHKAILAARSPYFEAMFKHNFKEKAENSVEIKDVNPEIFKEILTYIYTGKMDPQNLKENDAKELFVAADRFVLDGLKMAVKNLLVSKLTIENASELLVLGHVHSVEILKTKATDFVAANVKQVMETEGWAMLIREHAQLMGPILGAVTGT